jgi:hypothetical protein
MPSTQPQWLATLEAHAFPVIGDLLVATVGTDEVLRVLRPIWGLDAVVPVVWTGSGKNKLRPVAG